MATTLELPTDIWETIVKQSKQSAKELVKELSFDELREVIHEADKEITKKLGCLRNKYPKYTILKDNNNQTWVVVDGNYHRRYVLCEKMVYTTDITILGNYHKNYGNRNTSGILCYIDLETNKIHMTDADFEVIQYQTDLDATRISRANDLKVGDTFQYFKYTISSSFSSDRWDWRSKQLETACVLKNTPKYIIYDAVDPDGQIRRTKVEKKRVVC